MHAVHRIWEIITGNSTKYYAICEGALLCPLEHDTVDVDDLKSIMPIGHEGMNGLLESLCALSLVTHATSLHGRFCKEKALRFLQRANELRLAITDDFQAQLLSGAGWEAYAKLIAAAGIRVIPSNPELRIFEVEFVRDTIQKRRLNISVYAILHLTAQALPFFIDGMLFPSAKSDGTDLHADKCSKSLLGEGKILTPSSTANRFSFRTTVTTLESEDWITVVFDVLDNGNPAQHTKHSGAGVALSTNTENVKDHEAGLYCGQFMEVTVCARDPRNAITRSVTLEGIFIDYKSPATDSK